MQHDRARFKGWTLVPIVIVVLWTEHGAAIGASAAEAQLSPQPDTQRASRITQSTQTDNVRQAIQDHPIVAAYPLRRCLNITKGQPDRKGEPKDWNKLRVDFATAWQQISTIFNKRNVRYHLEWGNLISWQRDCEFNWRDHDLDIAAWATDYSAELEHELAEFGKSWCSSPKYPDLLIRRRRYQHPFVPGLVKPAQTQIICRAKNTRWELIDIIWMHRRGQNNLMPNNIGMLTDMKDEIEAPGARQPTDIKTKWWQSVWSRQEQRYFYYEPYKLVKADVLGVESLVPDDTSWYLTQHYGTGWSGTKSTGETWRKYQSTAPPLNQVTHAADLEWWRKLPANRRRYRRGELELVSPAEVRRLIEAQPPRLPDILPAVKAPYPLRRCANLTQGKPHTYQMLQDWPLIRRLRVEAWAKYSRVLQQAGVRYHLGMGNLLTWQRDCDMDFADPDLDIVVWATDYSVELEASLVGVSSEWCGKGVRPEYMRYRHPTVRTLVKPMLTRVRCNSDDSISWSSVDILWLQRRGRTDAVDKSGPAPALTNTSQEVEATSAQAVSHVPRSERWWLGVYEHKSVGYFHYDPYKLVRADVLGVESLVPDDTTHWLRQHYGHAWRKRGKQQIISWKSHMSLSPPVLGKDLHYDKEWWVEQPSKGHGLVPLLVVELERQYRDAVSTGVLRLPASAKVERRCGNLSDAQPDTRKMPSDWAIQRQEVGKSWRSISRVLTEAKAWHHIDWTTLIAWERDCDFNFRTRELVVVISAADYTSALEQDLVKVGRSTCGDTRRVAYIRQRRGQNSSKAAPMHTRLTCAGGKGGMHLLWLHGRTATYSIDAIVEGLPSAVDRQAVATSDGRQVQNGRRALRRWWGRKKSRSRVEKQQVWWVGYQAARDVQYVMYQSYSLVTADVFGVPSYVPSDVKGHVDALFEPGWDGRWRGRKVEPKEVLRSSVSTRWLKPELLANVHWWNKVGRNRLDQQKDE